MDLGLAAPLIIEPADQEPLPYDREVTLVLDDWATGTGTPVPDTDSGIAGGRGSRGGMMGGGMGGMMREMMGGRGMGGMMRGADEPAYDLMTINGKAYPATEPLRVKRGERVRVRIINVSSEHTHVVRLAGHRLHLTHTDGNPLRAAVEVDAIPIAPGERYDVLLDADRPGAWWLQCTQPGHAAAGERMVVTYDGHERETPVEPERGISGLRLWQYGLGRGPPVLAPPPPPPMRPVRANPGGGLVGGDG